MCLGLNTVLKSQNRISSRNSLVDPVVQYSFNHLNWTVADIKQMDAKARKLFTCHSMHHLKSGVDRVYVP